MITPPLTLDRAGGVPLHRQLYEAWRGAILAGRMRPGDRLPSTRSVADTYGVARITVTAAYDQLLAEGYLEARPGAGTFVSSALPDDLLRPIRVAASARVAVPPIHLSRYAARCGEISRLTPSTRAINMSDPVPDLTHFPLALWRRLIARQLRRTNPAEFGYGTHPAGHDALRAAISRHVARTRAIHCTPDQVIVVSGSQQALDLCARLLVDPGDEIAVEEPGYPGARQLFRAHGARVRTIGVTDSGASTRGLTPRTRLVHVTPSHQFPTGVSMTLARRLALLTWARTHGAVILEDDYDSDFRYSGPPLPAMHSLSDGANVVYAGTFSNVMFRGLRVGYVIVPRAVAPAFSTAKWLADRHTPLLEQAALAEFLEDGHLDRHIRRMRRLYKQRRDTLLNALDQHFGDRVRVRGDAAGLHLTVRFRDGAAVRANAERLDVHLAGTAMYYQARPATDEFIVGFSTIGERTIREGVKRLASGLDLGRTQRSRH